MAVLIQLPADAGTGPPIIDGVAQDDAHLFLHRTVILGGAHAQSPSSRRRRDCGP